LFFRVDLINHGHDPEAAVDNIGIRREKRKRVPEGKLSFEPVVKRKKTPKVNFYPPSKSKSPCQPTNEP